MQWKRRLVAAMCCTAAVTASLVSPAPAGPLPGPVQAPAARAVVRGPEIGGRASVVVADPKKAAALGLPGLAAGDRVDVAHPAGDVWTVTDPKTGRVVESRREPDLGP